MATAEERLARILADGNLMHTGARWRAHERAHPGSCAAELVAGYEERDAAKIVQVEVTLAEFRLKIPDDELTAYLEWVLAELLDEDDAAAKLAAWIAAAAAEAAACT